MPRKTSTTGPKNRLRDCFNEAAARCRGKHADEDRVMLPSMRLQ